MCFLLLKTCKFKKAFLVVDIITLVIGLFIAVNGSWSTWTDWSPCTESCGAGTRQKTRLCDNPVPLFGGAQCQGTFNEIESCSVATCPNDMTMTPSTGNFLCLMLLISSICYIS